MPRGGVDHQFVESGPAFAAIKDGDGRVVGAVGWVVARYAFIVIWIGDLDPLDIVCAEAHGLMCKRALHFVVAEIWNVEHGNRDKVLRHGWCTRLMVDAGNCWEFDSAKNKDLALVGQDAQVTYTMMLSGYSMSTASDFRI